MSPRSLESESALEAIQILQLEGIHDCYCMTMWGYLVGLCHDTVVPEIFMEGLRRFVTCLMFC
jgi:hypothetical protein